MQDSITQIRCKPIHKDRLKKTIGVKRDSNGVNVLILLLALGTIWQLASMHYSPLILPGPIATLSSLWEIIESKELLYTTMMTMKRLFIGLGQSVLAGVLLGVLMGVNPRVTLIYFI